MAAMITYEERLDADVRWAFLQGSLHFDRANWVHKTLEKLTRDLHEMAVAYAISGALAMFFHGRRRFTENVDVLITPEGFATVCRNAENRGYVKPTEGNSSRRRAADLRDAETGVGIKFQVTGSRVGRNTLLVYPDPDCVAVCVQGVRCVALPTLIDLKLAAGMDPAKLQNTADALALMRSCNLPLDLVQELYPTVRDVYRKLWLELQVETPGPDQ